MPLIRFTYSRDIAREGSDPVEVDDARAQLLLNQRRAVLVDQTPPAKPKPAAAARRAPRKRTASKGR